MQAARPPYTPPRRAPGWDAADPGSDPPWNRSRATLPSGPGPGWGPPCRWPSPPVLGDPPHPRSVVCYGGNYAHRSEREVPEFQCITYDFGDFTMTCENGNATNYMIKFPQEVRYGTQWPHWPTSATRIEIYGTEALMYLGRHGCGWQVVDTGGRVIEQDKGHFPDKWHRPDFIESMRTRRAPAADIALCHASACLVHLANTSFRMGQRQLAFDAATETFPGCPEADDLQRPAGRGRYRMPDAV